MIEEWRDIVGYEGRYKVSNMGKVISLNYSHTGKQKELKQSVLSSGYYAVNLRNGGKVKLCTVHRLVANAFLPNPNKYKEVNHINENTKDNRVENLEWCEQSDNMKHAYKNGLQIPSENQRKAIINTNKLKQKKVCQIKDGEIINTFSGISEASRQTKISISCISRCCNLKRKSTNGYEWRFL